jgi:hypothetical protein
MRARLIGLIVLMLLLVSASESAATTIYLVTWDTSPIQAAGDFSLDFQFLDGDGVQNNTVVLSDFSFGAGGSASGAPSLLGGASGDIATTITLVDQIFFNAFTQPFTPGSLLSFTLSLTTNGTGLPAPDRFALGIIDSSGFSLPTTGLAEEFLGIDLSVPLSISTFGSDTTRTGFDIAAPSVQAIASPVPEPSSILLLVTGLGAGVARRWRQGRQVT